MAVIRTATGAVISVPENVTVREVIEKLREQGFDNPVIYDPGERRPLAPDERVGNRDLRALDMSKVGQRRVEFDKSREYYAMMGWLKLARDFVVALYRGRDGLPILAMVAVGDAARWLCGRDEPCILLASIDHPYKVKDLIIRNRTCCDETIKIPQEFIEGLNRIYGVDLNPNLCRVHIEEDTPLQYVDDISLLIQVSRILSDPEKGFGLTFIHA